MTTTHHDRIAELTTLADTARDAAQRAGLVHAQRRHALAAAYLRERWPLAAAIEADLSDEHVLPQVTRIFGADGTLIHEVEWADDVPDEVPEALAYAVDFADARGAGWVQTDVDGTLYRLTLPPSDHDESAEVTNRG